MTNHAAQQERILRVLKAARGQWVPLPEIMKPPDGQGSIGQYNSRIWDLRQVGHQIENMKERVGKETHSWYRLITEGQQVMDL